MRPLFSKTLPTPGLPLLCAVLLALLLSACSADAPSDPPPDTAERVQLSIDNMHCRTCPIAVRKALEQVDGVHSAEVDYDRASATVVYDPSQASVAELSTATREAGFPSRPRTEQP